MKALVLSGGGNLGAIEVGALRALAEAGVRPDLIVGASVGALNGAFLAAEPSLDGVHQLERIWRGIRGRDVFPGGFLAVGFNLLVHRTHAYSNRGIRKLIHDHLAYRDLGDAAVPIHVVATDLISGDDRLFSRGPPEPALLASSAIPGVFPPVEIDRRLYTDGGVANNIPISHAVENGATTVYVVNVGYPCERSDAPRNAVDMILQALTIAREQRIRIELEHYRGKIEIVHIPPLCPLDISLTDFSQTGRLIEQSYEHATRFLSDPASVPADHHHGASTG